MVTLTSWQAAGERKYAACKAQSTRAHLGSEHAKPQATCFATCCMPCGHNLPVSTCHVGMNCQSTRISHRPRAATNNAAPYMPVAYQQPTTAHQPTSHQSPEHSPLATRHSPPAHSPQAPAQAAHTRSPQPAARSLSAARVPRFILRSLGLGLGLIVPCSLLVVGPCYIGCWQVW
jgi:hypothetical protein